MRTMAILIPKTTKILIVSHESEVYFYQYAGPGNRNSTTTLVGPSPAPDRCMHIFRRATPLWRVRSSATVAGGEVGALHVFLCFFHASFWHSPEQ